MELAFKRSVLLMAPTCAVGVFSFAPQGIASTKMEQSLPRTTGGLTLQLLLIALAGATGALSRYALQGFINDRTLSAFPYGTFVVNLSGSFLLGFLATVGLDRFAINPSYRAALTVGFVGAYTTFSTWSYETLHLIEGGSFGLAAANALGSLVAGLAAVWLGVVAGRLV